MSNSLFKIIGQININFRKNFYSVYRKLVESPIVYRFLSKLSRNNYKGIMTPENQMLYLNPIYHSNLFSTEAIKEYEPNMKRIFKDFIKEGMTVYDVGANMGLFSLYFCYLTGTHGNVVAFEPEENNFTCLSKAKEANNLNQLTIEMMCISDTSGEQTFDRRGGAFSGRLIDQNSHYKSKNITVKPTTSLDDYVMSNNNPVPDIIKIDVEGNEAKVIKGMTKILKNYEPIIICEIHRHLGDSLDNIFQLFVKNRYMCYNLNQWLKNDKAPLQNFNKAHHIIAIKNPVL